VNPQLSRRVGKLMMTDAVRALDLERHLEFVDEVSRAESFDVLPAWVREVVLEGERQFADWEAHRATAADEATP
jgi:hypothetical protein